MLGAVSCRAAERLGVLLFACDSTLTEVILPGRQLKANIGNNTGLLHTVIFAAL